MLLVFPIGSFFSRLMCPFDIDSHWCFTLFLSFLVFFYFSLHVLLALQYALHSHSAFFNYQNQPFPQRFLISFFGKFCQESRSGFICAHGYWGVITAKSTQQKRKETYKWIVTCLSTHT